MRAFNARRLLLDAFKLKADPVVRWTAFGPKNGRSAFEILNDSFHSAIVEKIADRHASAHLRNLDGIACFFADVLESSIAEILEEKFGLEIMQIGAHLIDLGIDMAIDDEDVLPAVVVEVDKGIAPADISARAAADAGRADDIGKVHVAVVAVKGRIFVIEMRDEDRHAPCVQIVAHGHAHVGLACAGLAQSHARGESNLFEGAFAVATDRGSSAARR